MIILIDDKHGTFYDIIYSGNKIIKNAPENEVKKYAKTLGGNHYTVVRGRNYRKHIPINEYLEQS